MKTLSPRQLATLGSVSNRAYKHLQSVGYPLPAYSEWRHEFTADVCGGRSSWKSLFQVDYIPLYNAFVRLYGGKEKADNTPQSDEAAMLWTLHDVIRAFEIPMPYVAKVIAGKASRPWITASMSLDTMCVGLSRHMLWQIVITLNNNFQKKNKKQNAALGIPNTGRPHASRSTIPPGGLPDWHGDTLATPPPPTRKRKKNPVA